MLPNLQVPGYPYSESGEFLAEGPECRHEQLTTASHIAAKTSRIGLVLAVMVVQHRPAVLAAKILATIPADVSLSASARAGSRRSSTRSWGRHLPREAR